MPSSAFNLFSMFSNTKSTFLNEQRELVAHEQRRASSTPHAIISLHPSEPHICKNSYNNKSISIPPSRVNDGICDCCDGSDEINMMHISACVDSCENLAHAEIALARKRSSAYVAGKQIRQQAIDLAQQHSPPTASVQDTRDKIDQLTRQRENVDQNLREKEASISERIESVRLNARPRVDAILGLSDLDDSSTVGLLISIFDVLGMQTVESIPLPAGWDLVDKSYEHDRDHYHDQDRYHDGDYQPEVSDHDGDYQPEVSDHHGDYQPEVSEKDSYHSDHEDNVQNINETADIPESQEENSPISSFCQQVREKSDARLSAIFSSCYSGLSSSSSSTDSAMSPLALIFHILETKPDASDPLSSFYRIQMAMAHYRLKGYFGHESVEFVTASEGKPCSSVLLESNSEVSTEALQMNCEVAELLHYAFQPLHSVIQENSLNVEQHQEIENSRNALSTLANDIQSLKTQLEDIEKEEREREKFMPAFTEYFSIRDSCFEKKDGQYTYKVCLGKDIQQIDQGATSGTSLGAFDRLEKDERTGGVTIFYKDGQYCHAFGPRTATVHVSCGETAHPVLTSASEPSTCAYSFVLEAPHACTHEFAQLHSIDA